MREPMNACLGSLGALKNSSKICSAKLVKNVLVVSLSGTNSITFYSTYFKSSKYVFEPYFTSLGIYFTNFYSKLNPS